MYPSSMKNDKTVAEVGITSLILPLYVPTLFILFGYGMIIPVLPLFARYLGAGVGIASVVVSMRGVGSLLFDLPAGAIISRAGRLPVLIMAAAAAALAAAATGLVGRLLPLVLLTIVDLSMASIFWIFIGVLFLATLMYSRQVVLTFFEFEYSLLMGLYETIFAKKTHDKIDKIASTRR